MSSRSLNLILLFMFVVLSGCKETATAYPTASPISPIISKSTFTAVPSANTSITATSGITVTLTPRPTTTITLTPLSIIPKDKVRAKFDQLYVYNAGCSLPCWWGITPGVTTWNETLHFLHQFDAVSTFEVDQKYPLTENALKFSHIIWYFPSPYREAYTRVDFEVQNGLVTAISLGDDIGGWMFDLEKLYKEYGNPNQVFVLPEDCPENFNFCDATIYYMYNEQRFLSENGVMGSIDGTTVSLCVSKYDNGFIYMWESGAKINLNASLGANSRFINIEQAKQEQISEFFMKSRNSTDSETCFDLPLDLWK